MEKFKVQRPKVSEGCPEVTVRESPDELTLRAEEVGTLKTYINVDNMEKERCPPLWLITTEYAVCQALYNRRRRRRLGRDVPGLQRNEQGCGVKKPQEAQKAKALQNNTTTPRVKTTSGEEARQD